MAKRPISSEKGHDGSWSISERRDPIPRLRVGTRRTAVGANTVLAIRAASVSLVCKVANQNFTASFRMTALSWTRQASVGAAGYLPVRRRLDKPRCREVCGFLPSLSETLDARMAEMAGEPMIAATLDIKSRPQAPVRRDRPAPEIQIELELPLVAPEASEPAHSVPRSDPTADRGIAVIDFYI